MLLLKLKRIIDLIFLALSYMYALLIFPPDLFSYSFMSSEYIELFLTKPNLALSRYGFYILCIPHSPPTETPLPNTTT